MRERQFIAFLHTDDVARSDVLSKLHVSFLDARNEARDWMRNERE